MLVRAVEVKKNKDVKVDSRYLSLSERVAPANNGPTTCTGNSFLLYRGLGKSGQ